MVVEDDVVVEDNVTDGVIIEHVVARKGSTKEDIEHVAVNEDCGEMEVITASVVAEAAVVVDIVIDNVVAENAVVEHVVVDELAMDVAVEDVQRMRLLVDGDCNKATIKVGGVQDAVVADVHSVVVAVLIGRAVIHDVVEKGSFQKWY